MTTTPTLTATQTNVRGLWTADLAAARCGVTERTMEAWRRRGIGPRYVVLPSRRVRCDPEEVERWLAERTRRSTSDPGV